MAWSVISRKKVQKQVSKLPVGVKERLYALLLEIENDGPVRGNWPNYGKIGNDRHHCHLKKGIPTYVAVWEVNENRIKLVEVIYVGSHEKAPY
jgi:mRNA-degrading endonuclease RelE of RelBE toxin-antitoxin system